MKKLVVLLTVLFLCAGAAYAQDGAGDLDGWIIEGAFGFATEPADDFGSGYGFGLGVSQSLLSLFPGAGRTGFTENLLLRADLNYFMWDHTESVPGASAEVELTRLPVFLGGRYVIPAKLGNVVSMYAEGGIEISFDEVEAAACIAAFPPLIPTATCVTKSDDEVNLGVTPGFGLAIPITDQIIVGADLRLHIISDTYFTGMATLGIKLN